MYLIFLPTFLCFFEQIFFQCSETHLLLCDCLGNLFLLVLLSQFLVLHSDTFAELRDNIILL